MQIVAISCIRDEVDIVEAFVRHTLAQVSQLVVLDNGSTDGTRQLLQQLVAEGLPLEVVDDPSPGHYQWRRMTHLMRAHAVQKYAADWVLPLDADEFLAADDLSRFLSLYSHAPQPIGITMQTYVPDSRDNASATNPVERIRHRLLREARTCVKVIIPGALARLPDVSIAQGNHSVERAGIPVATHVTADVSLAHFPGRTPSQLIRKVAVKHLQYLAMSDRLPNWGSHYRAKVELLRQDLSRVETEFQQTMLRYNLPEGMPFEPVLISAPLNYRGGPLRYTPATAEKPIHQSLLECAEMLASAHSSLAREQNRLRDNFEQLTTELRQREAALAAFRQSWSWRIGRTVTSPLRWMKQHLRSLASAY